MTPKLSPSRLPMALPLLTAIAVSVAVALSGLFTGCSQRDMTEDQAVDLLAKRVLADGLYPASRQGECLSFEVEQRLDARFEIAVREKHGGTCPGDPGTGPVLDRFEVQQDGAKLRRYDPIGGAYVDYTAPATGG
ncbi:MAG: hypothetical protein WAQ08_04530 [Aquabacterium sp.]|jgi:hypothetical protein|uniref:hypothetical protein n=1 Tax=Aquabacterium sp. TaxID=1872578 RepID=UPI003BB0D8EB